MSTFKPGLYQHNNGNLYHAIGVCRHEESLEEMVIYRALYNDYGLWVRPRSKFEGMVLKDGVAIPRFEFIQAIDVAPPRV